MTRWEKARKKRDVTFIAANVEIGDKFIVILTLVLLSSMNKISVLPVILILAREFYIFGIRSLAIENKLVIPAGMGGKIKTMLQMYQIFLPFLPNFQSRLDVALYHQQFFHNR